ncbi:YALI0A04719p [Yarrowia lipolytica CLIB122]|uniref:YALI0A04719p n=2 Tax=Yarrowia lipolytica TaxID=4952 RepID=Q6CHU9_YARLI|nr:YALI0A04719p [Yarrowia lipolytica CLIB122]AOW00260.1 hypothetical protein YALI1_A04884g [Yarrowia lipolytica]CAG83686.2 YALI0A04719p [Yarrowia lipolytica CLIB122]|eukprot:XP_499762.2 YALI0A04719p [Yarrowia lipolytica CLIB122]
MSRRANYPISTSDDSDDDDFQGASPSQDRDSLETDTLGSLQALHNFSSAHPKFDSVLSRVSAKNCIHPWSIHLEVVPPFRTGSTA